ncbi:MAG TPA: YciI family protein [Gemmatimonadaceae bacterium]|nr:YciI family protein [Gemmatimonadaceae bacterium]
MRYMMFIIHKELGSDANPPQSLFDAMGEFVGAELKSGRLIDTGGLQPSRAGTRIRSRNGKLTVTDGPFTEAKEIVGGYALVEVRSRDEAMELATKFMELHRMHWPEFDCTCEVRPLEIEPPPSQ